MKASRLKRLLPRFSLRTLLVFVALTGCVSALWIHRHPWRCERVLRGHEGDVLSAAFSPDGRRVVTAGFGDKTARVWDAATGGCLAVLGGHEGDVLSAAFSPDGRRVVTAGAGDQTARIWKRVRPEYRWGVVAMPELWATVAFCALLAWSILRDRRRFRAASV